MIRQPPAGAPRARAVALALVLALAGAAVFWTFRSGRPLALAEFLRGFASVDAIQAWVARFSLAGPLVMLLLQAAQVVVAPIPGAATAMASGLLFGPWIGFLVSFVGVAGGSAAAFLLARRFGRPWVVRVASRETLDRLDRFVLRRGATALFLIFLIPFLPDDVACLAAGITPVPFRLFMLLVLVGRAPSLVVGTLTGAGWIQLTPAGWALLAVGALLLAFLLTRYEERLLDRPLDRTGR